MDYVVVKRVELGPAHTPTGRTRHYSGGELVPGAASLAIARYSDGDGYYLLHFNADGEEIADSFHETLEDALKQAEFEFGVSGEEWVFV